MSLSLTSDAMVGFPGTVMMRMLRSAEVAVGLARGSGPMNFVRSVADGRVVVEAGDNDVRDVLLRLGAQRRLFGICLGGQCEKAILPKDQRLRSLGARGLIPEGGAQAVQGRRPSASGGLAQSSPPSGLVQREGCQVSNQQPGERWVEALVPPRPKSMRGRR